MYLTSNGSLATPERIRAVIDAGLDSLKFSVNAPQRKLYAFIHGHDDFDKVEVFDGLADQVVFKYVYNQGGYMPEIDELLRCDCDNETRRRCNLPFDAISVTQEGYLSVENADYKNMLIVADLNKVSLRDGWYGEKMKDIRRRFIEDDLAGTLCDGCVHHECREARPIMPECSSVEGSYVFDDSLVRGRINNSGLTVYVPMSADIIHPGHINIPRTAARYGRVIVGLFADEAISSYKPKPYMTYEQRKIVVESLKYVDEVVPQMTRDYDENIRRLKPDFMIHGKDWREGPLADVRAKAIATMSEWGGQVIEPDYTKGVSSSMIRGQIR